MAKVTGPLFSIEARGKIADAMVFFPWKGRNVVREWKKPSNPQTSKQNQARMHMGGLGRAVTPVLKTSLWAEYARAVTDSGQTWVSQFVRWMLDNIITAHGTFDDFITEVANHGATADWEAEAITLGMVDFNLNPKVGVKMFSRRAMPYALAKYATMMHAANAEKFNSAPYTTALADWDNAKIELQTADFAEI